MPKSYSNSQTVIDLAKDFHAEPELAAKKMNAPLDKVLELQKSIKVNA